MVPLSKLSLNFKKFYSLFPIEFYFTYILVNFLCFPIVLIVMKIFSLLIMAIKKCMYLFCQRPLIRKNWKQRVEFFKIQRHFVYNFNKGSKKYSCLLVYQWYYTCFFHRMSGQVLKQNTIPPLINCLWSNTIHKIVKLFRSLALFKRQLLQFNRSVVTVWKIFFLYQFMRGHVICI